MKNLSYFFAFIILLSTKLLAQTPPNAFNYSAVARNAAGQPIATTTIGIQITILKTSPTGASQYSENHFVNTDAFGLFNLIVGAGAAQSGSMSTIDWSNDNYYLKVGMDAAGGTNFLTMGTTQLLSVPYALYAKSAGTVSGANETDPVFGASVAGGITGADTAKWNNKQNRIVAGAGISIAGDTIRNNGISISSVSSTGDTLYLSNGQTFVATSNAGGTGNLVLPTITTNAVTGITSNSATFGGSISNAIGYQIIERGIVYSTSPNPILGSNKIIIGNGIGTFDTTTSMSSSYPHLLSPNTTYYVRAYAITENNISAYGNQVSFTTLPVGQVGPAGGIVFFDKGNSNGGWQYLESATSDQSTSIAWGCSGTSIPGTQLRVGSGETNTSLIVAGCNDASFAAKLCDNLSLGGQTDWFLPSIDELNLMYRNLHLNNQGNFNLNPSAPNYWSSTETDGLNAWSFNFINGNPFNFFKSVTYYVRAVRAF